MRYYALYNENNKLIAIGTGAGGVEITESEYNALLAEICEKAIFENKVYAEEITLEEVPSEWRDEIQRRVNERIEWEKVIEETAEAIDPAEFGRKYAETEEPIEETVEES